MRAKSLQHNNTDYLTALFYRAKYRSDGGSSAFSNDSSDVLLDSGNGAFSNSGSSDLSGSGNSDLSGNNSEAFSVGSSGSRSNDDDAISNSSSDSLASAIAEWRDLESVVRDTILLSLAPEGLAVNRYKSNPYCYLITSFTSRCGDYLAAADVGNALRCVELATEAALDMYRYSRRHCDDEPLLEDIKFSPATRPRGAINSAAPAKNY